MEDLKQKAQERPNDFDFGKYVRHSYAGNDADINQLISDNPNDQTLGAAVRAHLQNN